MVTLGVDWAALGPFGASVSALAISPHDGDVVYLAASSDGLFKSTDGAGTWESTGYRGQGILNAIVVDPVQSETVYLGSTQGFFVSEDGGSTWSQRNRGLSTSYLNALVSHPTASGTLYAGAWGGLFKTTTAGEDWVDIGSSLGEITVQAIIVDPNTPSTVYIGTSQQGVFRSKDGGSAWQPINNGLTDLFVRDLLITQGEAPTLCAATNHSGVFTSEDGGANWIAASEGVKGNAFRLAGDPGSPEVVYLGTQAYGVFRTADGGASWTPWNDGLPSSSSVYGLALREDTGTLFAGLFREGIYRRAATDAAWVAANDALAGYTVGALLIDGETSKLLAGIETYGPSVFRSSDGGETWAQSRSGIRYPPVHCLARDPSDRQVVLAGNFGSLYRSTDGGATWMTSDTGLERGFITVRDLLFDGDDPDTVVAATNRGIWVSHDGGQAWGDQALPNAVLYDLARESTAPGRLIAGGDAGVLQISDDGGASWRSIAEGLSSALRIRAIVFDPASPNTIYVGTEGRGIFRSTDAGASWTLHANSSDTVDTYAFLALPGPPTTLLAGTSAGVFSLDRATDSWSPVGTSLPRAASIQYLTYDPDAGLLYACGHGGIFALNWGP
jgi:photosystem II stability/assembly factor-like uncharacterized protein